MQQTYDKNIGQQENPDYNMPLHDADNSKHVIKFMYRRKLDCHKPP